MKELTVKYQINEEQEKSLNTLLEHWQNYTRENGDKPFSKWKIEDLFQKIMFIGSTHTINEKIQDYQLRWK